MFGFIKFPLKRIGGGLCFLMSLLSLVRIIHDPHRQAVALIDSLRDAITTQGFESYDSRYSYVIPAQS
jgi:hypothetical protein